VPCAGIWELAFFINGGRDSHVAGFLVVMATLTYLAIMALAGVQLLVLRQERPGRRPAGAAGHPGAGHRPAQPGNPRGPSHIKRGRSVARE
jgi:hypothetical protein